MEIHTPKKDKDGKIKETSIDVEALCNKLKSRKTLSVPFRFSRQTPQQVYEMLVAACKSEVELRRRKFVMDESYRHHLKEIALWLTSDDPTFGLFLCGNVGSGKSTILYAIQSLVNLLGKNRDAGDFSGCIIKNAKELNRLARAYYNPTHDTETEAKQFKMLRNIEILAIDDLGTEPRETMYYGDYITPVIDILSERYDKQKCTLITTNLEPGDIAGAYDERIADRFKEMMKVINFEDNKSFRQI